MKRNLIKVLAAVMLAGGMTVNVNADYSTDENKIDTTNNAPNSATGNNGTVASSETVGSKEIDVKVQTGGSDTVTHVYAVSYDTTELNFTYGASAGIVWNPVSLKYENASAAEGGWTPASQDINVTNYSDVDIKVDADTEVNENETGHITLTSSTDSAALTLASAYDGGTPAISSEAGTSKTGTVTISISGVPAGSYSDGYHSVGTVTLNVTGDLKTE